MRPDTSGTCPRRLPVLALGPILALTLGLIVTLTPVAPAAIDLTVDRGSAPDSVELTWTGGASRYAVFRATNAADVQLQANWMLETPTGAWTDTSAYDTLLFYRIVGDDDCPPGQLLCEGGCIDPFTDGDHCGACGHTCDDTHATNAFCTNGTCAASCFGGYGDCGRPASPAADDGCESNLDTDPDHCGACGNACADGWDCNFGMCQPPSS